MPKARKEHRCTNCGRRILVEEDYSNETTGPWTVIRYPVPGSADYEYEEDRPYYEVETTKLCWECGSSQYSDDDLVYPKEKDRRLLAEYDARPDYVSALLKQYQEYEDRLVREPEFPVYYDSQGKEHGEY